MGNESKRVGRIQTNCNSDFFYRTPVLCTPVGSCATQCDTEPAYGHDHSARSEKRGNALNSLD